jgi:hypothetical protein
MANPNIANGLVPIGTLQGNPYNGAYHIYTVPAADPTLIGIGDLVKINGTGQTVNDTVYQDVIRAAQGDVFVGVVTAVLPETRDSTVYREASTLRRVCVADDPDLVFEIQEVSGGTQIAVNDIGLNANILVAGASTTTGLSGTMLDNATPPAVTNTLDLKIVGFSNKPNNAVGANAKWIVRINRHLYVNQIAGV